MRSLIAICALYLAHSIASPLAIDVSRSSFDGPVINLTAISESMGDDLETRSQRLYAVFSSQDFSTVDAGGGSQFVHGHGFAILNPSHNEVFAAANPGGYAPCMAPTGNSFAVRGIQCMGGQYIFWCETVFSGAPKRCAVWQDDVSLANRRDVQNADNNNWNIGLAAGTKGLCVISWTIPGFCAKNQPGGQVHRIAPPKTPP